MILVDSKFGKFTFQNRFKPTLLIHKLFLN